MMAETSTHVAFQILLQTTSSIMNGKMEDFVQDSN
jgi:hypothetical protein